KTAREFSQGPFGLVVLKFSQFLDGCDCILVLFAPSENDGIIAQDCSIFGIRLKCPTVQGNCVLVLSCPSLGQRFVRESLRRHARSLCRRVHVNRQPENSETKTFPHNCVRCASGSAWPVQYV